MPDDARRALLTRFFDHAPMFPPASLPTKEALAEDRRARESEHAWMLGRLVWPSGRLAEMPQDEGRALALVAEVGGMEAQGEAIYIEARKLRTWPRCSAGQDSLRRRASCRSKRSPSSSVVAATVA
jgi:hypothetical protein